MKRDDERLLLRVATGAAGAGERAELERRAADDPALAAALESWRKSWDGLEAPAPEPPPPGWSARVMARAREQSERPGLGVWPGLAGHPGLARLAAALILGAGIALGAGLGALAPAATADDDGTALWSDDSLADSYLAAAADPSAAAEEQP
jgi:anti-sigma-K factor RskA